MMVEIQETLPVDEKLFEKKLWEHGIDVRPESIETLWLNITRQCNQACRHCHVDASPYREEHMDRRVMEQCLTILKDNPGIHTVDITGGEPELNPNFGFLVNGVRSLDRHIRVRHNLTVIFDGHPVSRRRMDHLPDYFAENGIEVLASMPYYEDPGVASVRGPGVFEKSIRALKLLNEKGYGQSRSGLELNLMYNADSPLTSGEREFLEATFRERLMNGHGVVFNQLYVVTNVPINRYRRSLAEKGTLHDYLRTLEAAFTPDAVKDLVCRSLISVDYTGRLYDCDFNQMEDLPVLNPSTGAAATVWDYSLQRLLKRDIRFGLHCLGCTAGGGGG